MKRRSFLAALGVTAGVGATDAGLTRRLDATAERFDFGLRFNDMGTEVGHYTRIADLDPDPRRVARAAVDGGYRTAEVPDWLRRFLAGATYLRDGGEFYELDQTLPEFVVRPEAVSESAVDGPVADAETYEAARTSEWGVDCGVTCSVDGSYETTRTAWLDPEMRAFLREYEYVRYRGEVVHVPLTVDDPGPPYTVTAESVPASTVRDGKTLELSTVPEEFRDALRAAALAPGAYGANDLPESVVSAVESHEYLRVDGRFYVTYLSDVRDVPLAVDCAVTSPSMGPADPAAFELSLRNDGDRPVEVFSGPPMPFGVLSAHRDEGLPPREGEYDHERTLWSEEYRESRHVSTVGRRVLATTGVGRTLTLAPGEAATTTYEIGGIEGTWVVADSVGGAIDGRDGDVPFRVALSVQ